MDERIGLIIQLQGDTQAISSLRDLKRYADDLNNNRVQLKIETSGIDRELAQVRRRIADLQQDRKNAVRMKADTTQLDKELDEAIRKRNELTQKKAELRVDATVNTESLRLANELLSEMDENARRVSETIQGIASIVSGAFGGLADFSSGIGSAFGAMADVFNTDLAETVKRTLTYTATRYVTGNMGGIISRYDTMNTFTEYMELAGVSADKAAESLDRVDQSIRGIPIGLDESATRLRRYQMYLGDIERATDLTIGLQRALIAGGSSEQMQTTAYTQIDRLLATGKLGQSRQWISLFNGLGVSLKFLKEELALDPTASMQTIAADLAAGRIAADDFLKAIERLAYNDELGNAIEIYKSTISAWMSNIKNAIKRGGQNVMVALNEVMEDTFGYGITGVMKGVRDEIDSVSKSMGEFVRQNPQNLERLANVFSSIGDITKNIDFAGFIENLITRIEQLGGIIRKIFDAFPDGFLEDFSAFAMVLAGPLSKIFSVVASGAGIVLGIFDRFKEFDFEDLIEKIVTQVERLAKVVSGLLGLIPDGLLGDLMAFGLVWGRPLAKVIGGIGSALGGLFNTIRGVNTGRGGTLLSDLILVGQSSSIAGAAMGLTGFAAAIGAVGYALNSYFSNKTKEGMAVLKELSGLDFDDLISDAESATKGIRDALKGFDEDFEQVGVKADMIDEVARKILQTNDKLKTDSNEILIAEQKRNLEELQELADIEIQYDADTGLLLNEAEAVKQLSGDYLNLAKAKQEAEALSGLRTSALTNMIEAQASANVRQDQLRAAEKELDRLNRWYENHQARNVQDLDGSQQVAYNPYMLADMPEGYEGIEGYDRLAQATNEARDKVELLKEQVHEANLAAEESADYYERYSIELGKVNYEIAKMEREGITVFDWSGQAVDFAQADDNLKEILASYKAFADGAREAIDEVITGFSEMEAAATVSAETIQKNLQSQLDYLTNLNGNLGELMKFVTDNLGTVRGEGAQAALSEIMTDPSAYAGELQGIVDALHAGNYDMLDQVFGTYNEIQAKKEEYANLVADIETTLNHGMEGLEAIINNPALTDGGLLEKVFGTDMYEAVVEMIQAATEEYTSALGDMEGATEDLEGAMGELKAEAHMVEVNLKGAGDSAEGSDKKLYNTSTSAGTLSRALGIAAGEARALANNLNSLPTEKIITVKVNYSGHNGNMGRRMSGHVEGFAKGGTIPQYFDEGNWVNFVPRGTDTVPAMLTPGEFVVRKSAAQMWGKPFLEAVNGMDMTGAFNAMWSKVSHLAHSGVVNNYRDNHAVVNIHNYGGNQTYSQKQAQRWASML